VKPNPKPKTRNPNAEIHQVGRVTPCAPNLDLTNAPRRGLTRPTMLLALALLSTLNLQLSTALATNLNFAIRVAGAGQVELAWDTATNAAYRLESCASLARTPTAEQSGSVNEFTTWVTDGAAWATNRLNVEVTP
jgi:hypothetical protein